MSAWTCTRGRSFRGLMTMAFPSSLWTGFQRAIIQELPTKPWILARPGRSLFPKTPGGLVAQQALHAPDNSHECDKESDGKERHKEHRTEHAHGWSSEHFVNEHRRQCGCARPAGAGDHRGRAPGFP